MGQKYVKFESKLLKSPLIYPEIPKKFPLCIAMGQFLKKRSTDYFENGIFFHVGEVPNRFQQEVERRYFKSKSRSKKPPTYLDSYKARGGNSL